MHTQTGTLESLLERVERLERQNRGLKNIGLLLMLALGSIFVMGQAKVPPVKAAKALEAGKFLLKDGRGQTRAELGLFADRPALVIYGPGQNPLLSIGTEPEGVGLTLYDRKGQKAAMLKSGTDGPVLTFCHDGIHRMNLSVTSQGPAVGLLGKKGEARGALGLTSEDNSFLQLFGEGERGGIQLLSAADRSVLRFFDPSDRARAVLGIADIESSPGLVLNDGAGTARVILTLTAQGPGLEFFDQNRVRIWSAR